MGRNSKKIFLGIGIAVAALLPAIGVAAGPYLQLSTYSGLPGSTVTINGYQFGASTNVFVSLAGTSTGAAMSGGSFTTTLTIPNASAGSYTVLATSPQREQASASFYIQEKNYYPTAHPSAWYLTPGQQLTFSGSGYAPNTPVTIQGGSGVVTASTDSSGNFSTASITVPYAWQNSHQSFMVLSSGAYTISLALSIGTFYPNLNPSTYYVGHNQSMSATASGFAPQEPIMLFIDGAIAGQKNADGSGAASFDITAPVSGNNFTLTAQGVYSHVMTSHVIALH